VRGGAARTGLKFAAFAVVCLVVTAWLAFTIGNVALFSHRYALSATFDDVTGLLPNDNVKVAGVPVGKVTGIKVVDGRARVSFTVRDDVRLPTDSKAAVRWRNLLGQRYVYLYPGQAATTLRPGSTITRTVSVVEIGELFNRLGPIVRAIDPDKVNQFLDSVVAALDGNEPKLRQAIADLSTLTSALAERDAAIGRLVENLNVLTGTVNSRDAQIRTVLDNLLAVATTFNENTDVLESAVVQLGSFNRDLGALLEGNRAQLDRTITNLTTLADGVRRQLPNVDLLLARLDDGTKRLFAASRYGEWLNQTIPCGRVGYPGDLSVAVKDCITGGPGHGGSVSISGVPPAAGLRPPPDLVPVRGAHGLANLLGVPTP
jgi:phospholipid/cholesterol/gamma-HCH transport system substrate-binding protein